MSDDRASRRTPFLASDAERERSIALLRDAVGEGRLTLEEFSERVGLAQAARTDQELARLARDLPGDRAPASLPAAVSEEHRALCSHLVRSGPWSLPPQSSWRSIFGTIDLDLRQARLVPKPRCRHATRVDGPEGLSGRNASPSGITPSNISSPAPEPTRGSWTKVSPGARAQRRIQHAHAPPGGGPR